MTQVSKTIKYRIDNEGNMAIEFKEFYYLIGACAAYLVLLIAYNAIGGKKKKSKKA